jgi:sensor histidine kinase YesM
MAVAAMKAKSTVESLREIVQDLLVPELKALKVEMASLRGDLVTGLDAVRIEMRLRDEKQSQAIQALSDKLSYAIDIRERLASVEARLPRN